MTLPAIAHPHLTTEHPADPRIGALLNLTQGMITKYGELAGILGENIADEAIRRELVEHVQAVMGEAHEVWGEIATMPEP